MQCVADKSKFCHLCPNRPAWHQISIRSCTCAITSKWRFKSKVQLLFFTISITRPSPPILIPHHVRQLTLDTGYRPLRPLAIVMALHHAKCEKRWTVSASEILQQTLDLIHNHVLWCANMLPLRLSIHNWPATKQCDAPAYHTMWPEKIAALIRMSTMRRFLEKSHGLK